jgi:hypothetical protein
MVVRQVQSVSIRQRLALLCKFLHSIVQLHNSIRNMCIHLVFPKKLGREVMVQRNSPPLNINTANLPKSPHVPQLSTIVVNKQDKQAVGPLLGLLV